MKNREMLLNKYFTIHSVERRDEDTIFHVTLNPNHEIYRGHFQGNPISPGVCTVEMVKECAQQITEAPLSFANIKNCRFISLLTPASESELLVHVNLTESEEGYAIKANVNGQEQAYLTLSGELCVNE